MNYRILQTAIRSSWVMALVPSLICLSLINKPGRKYNFTVEDFNHRGEELMAFEDLDGDGMVEWILARTDTSTDVYPTKIAIARSDLEQLKALEQVNLADHLVNNLSNLNFGDYDNDGAKEIFLFTQKADSIFLNEVEMFDAQGLRQERHFITRFGREKADHVSLFVSGLFDRNHDGSQELFFSITSGFGLWPRLVYCYDFATQEVAASPYTSINLDHARMTDIDDDGRPEIYGANAASGNHHFPTPYSDYSTWVMVYDDQLRFKFKPLGFEGFGNWNITAPIRSKSFKGIVVLLNANDATSKESSRILLLDPAGNVVKEKLLSELGVNRTGYVSVHPFRGENRIFVLANKSLVLNDDLQIIAELPWDTGGFKPAAIERIDVDFDGEEEFVVLSLAPQTMAIADREGTFLGVIPALVHEEQISLSSYITPEEKKIFVSSNSYRAFIKAEKNPNHWLGYLAVPGIYLAFVLLISVIQKVTISQVEKREALKRRVQELQLRSIKGQLDPHFTFNALNAIGSMLKLEDRNVAYDYLSKFTRLLRTSIDDAEKVWRPLRNEIEFVVSYLGLEKLRFEEKFDYSIEIGEDVTQEELVPVMCIQIFVENALRHGIMPLESGGKIWISIRRVDNSLTITIRDNGIGRDRASRTSDGLGKGLKMTREFYELLNSSRKNKIEFSLQDLYNKEPVGTEATLRIPL